MIAISPTDPIWLPSARLIRSSYSFHRHKIILALFASSVTTTTVFFFFFFTVACFFISCLVSRSSFSFVISGFLCCVFRIVLWLLLRADHIIAAHGQRQVTEASSRCRLRCFRTVCSTVVHEPSPHQLTSLSCRERVIQMSLLSRSRSSLSCLLLGIQTVRIHRTHTIASCECVCVFCTFFFCPR